MKKRREVIVTIKCSNDELISMVTTSYWVRGKLSWQKIKEMITKDYGENWVLIFLKEL